MSSITYKDRPLDIIIIGAGLGGLSAAISCALGGHNVSLLEGARELAEVGAGLQITPNGSRLFQQWGIDQVLAPLAAEPTLLAVHRYSDGKTLALQEDFDKKIRQQYGAPFWDLHRVDLQRAMAERAQELGVKLELGARVKDVDFETSSLRLENGTEYMADLLVGADGLWSRCREAFLKLDGKADKPLPTGDLAYRIVLNAEDLDDPKLKAMISKPQCHFWVGPGAHVVAYSVRGGKQYNIVLLVPDNLPEGVAKQTGELSEMRELFTTWDPILNRFLDNVKSVDKWKLMHRPELESWVSKQSNFVFLGDACHPMLPYLAQGANSSLEDGAVLGNLLAVVKSKSQLPEALRLYETLRKKRGEAIVRETFAQRSDFHMGNGPEQQARDELFQSQLGKELNDVKFPSRWTCPTVQPWLYGYDAKRETDVALKGSSLLS
ncbi:hypothetical protein AAFC00_003638 [Neodothiora populina]|uniref:FAD-binding domain-containing protein n=1 Tax=Neodothiora populina TaxID=2781224 RepID=A0ABR3PEV2_9PEZI